MWKPVLPRGDLVKLLRVKAPLICPTMLRIDEHLLPRGRRK